MPQVKTIRFISKNQALAQERKKHPAMVNSLPYNPFPNAFKVYPKQAEQIDTIAEQLGKSNLKGIESICPPAPGSRRPRAPEGRAVAASRTACSRWRATYGSWC